jgi:hypothetical protein
LIENISEHVANVYTDKTAGLLSVSCMDKEFRTCKFDMKAYDSLGDEVLEERDIESATYKIHYNSPGEYKITFSNRDVAECHPENRKTSLYRVRMLLV